MADANKFLLNEANSKIQLTDKKGHNSVGKSQKERHDNSLHKLLQKTAFKPRRDFPWAHPVAYRASQNLFLEGFRDCASEVIRFLTEEENVDDNNPLLIGLQSHLTNVSKTICHETITDLDRCDADNENKGWSITASPTRNDQNDNQQDSVSQFSPFMISPNISRSANSSLSDTSITELDISMSLSSTSEKSDESLVSESRSSVRLPSIESPNENLIDHIKVDDVFHSPSARDRSSNFKPISSLRFLSMNALQNINNPGHTSKMKEESSNDTSLFLSEQSTHESLSPAFSFHYFQSSNQSSPLLESPTATHSEDSNRSSHFPFSILNKLIQFPTVPEWNECLDRNTNPLNPNMQLSEEPHQLLLGNTRADDLRSCQNFVPFGSDSTEHPQRHSDFLRQINYVLEQKVSPQIQSETSSVSSGSFADILLTVESCRFHEDPRVRGLAEELLHFIHTDEFDDEEDDISDDHNDEDDHNINEEAESESGVELLGGSADWGNAADMIEQ